MSRLFLSILGTSLYKECNYYWKDQSNSASSRFVQEASIRLLCKDWNENDRIVIFTTQKAFKENYSTAIRERFDSSEKKIIPYMGLEQLLEALNLKVPFQHEMIEDGNSEEEIWQNFNILYSALREGDEIYLDITHSFRYLPILLLNLLSYSEYLKRTSIKAITYGNYEVARVNDTYAPIMDLFPLVLLKDWSLSVNNFERFGDVEDISRLCQDSLRPILEKSRGSDSATADRAINSFSKNLPNFVKSLQTCRGKELIDGKLAVSLSQNIENIEETSLPPFNPIFSRLKTHINRFASRNNIKNGFEAVNWCIKNGLIQQGLTLFQETIISLVCEMEQLDYSSLTSRDIVSGAFYIKFNKTEGNSWKGECSKPENRAITVRLLDNHCIISCCELYYKLSQLRNDINHAGFKQNSMGAKQFAVKLADLFASVEKILPDCLSL